MESKIIKEEKNPFLERTEIVLELKNETAPSFEDVKNAIGKEGDLIVVKKINSNFGRQTFIAEAVMYDNIEAKRKIETIPKKIKKKMVAEEKAEKEAAKKAEEAAKKAEAEAKAAEEVIATEPITEEIKSEKTTE